jgi:hypothetical protein
MKTLKLLTQLGLLTTASLSMATDVNINHLAPFADDINDTEVSINVNGGEVLSNINYLQSSGLLELTGPGVAPGVTSVEVFNPPGSSTPAISETIELVADATYSISAIGDGVNQPLSLLPLIKPQEAPEDNNLFLRVIHAAPFNSNIDDTAVSIRFDDGTVVGGMDTVLYGQASDFIEIPTGTYDLNISTVDGSTRLIDLVPLDLPPGITVNVFATGDGVNQPLGAYVTFSDGSSAILELEGNTSTAQTRVNVAHLAPFAADLMDTAVAVNINENEVLSGVQYMQASGYLTLSDDGTPPGETLVEIFAPPGSNTAAISNSYDLVADTDYTVVAIGDGLNQPLDLLPLVDDNALPTSGFAKLRIVHTAPFTENIADTAVSIRTDDGDLVAGLSDVRFGDNSGYLELPVGLYDLNVATPDGLTRLIDLAPITLNDGDIFTVFAIGNGVDQELGFYAISADGSGLMLPTEPPFNTLNPGLNGSWYNPETDGQGFFIEIFPELGTMFVAWFTFDTTPAGSEETAVIGDPNHRWYTAQGPYDGTAGELTLYNTEGGIFNQNTQTSNTAVGTLNIDFDGCRTAVVEFDIPANNISGTIPLTRISGSTVEFCESLIEQ